MIRYRGSFVPRLVVAAPKEVGFGWEYQAHEMPLDAPLVSIAPPLSYIWFENGKGESYAMDADGRLLYLAGDAPPDVVNGYEG